MDNTFHQEESVAQRPINFLAMLLIVKGIFKWWTSLIELTEEEQDDAGVYLGGEGRG